MDINFFDQAIGILDQMAIVQTIDSGYDQEQDSKHRTHRYTDKASPEFCDYQCVTPPQLLLEFIANLKNIKLQIVGLIALTSPEDRMIRCLLAKFDLTQAFMCILSRLSNRLTK